MIPDTVEITCTSCENIETISKDEFEASLSIEEGGITRVCPNCGTTQLIQQSDTTPPEDTPPDDSLDMDESELIVEPVSESLDALTQKKQKGVASQLMKRMSIFRVRKENEVI